VTLRVRISAVAGLAVALAVLAVAITVYIAVRADLRGQIDESLTQRAAAFVSPPAGEAPNGPGGGASGAGASGAGASGSGAAGGGAARPGASGNGEEGGGPGLFGPGDGDGGGGPNGFPEAVQPERFGEASGYVEFISPSGGVEVPSGQGSSPSIPASSDDRSIAAHGRGRTFSDRTVKGTHLRVLTVGSGAQGAVLIARPLTAVDHELNRVLLILLIVGASGIAVAALLGGLVARTALAPIDRFTQRTERLTGSVDLSQRVEVRGRDELARLAQSFNAALDALERSVEGQRQLIADASHELRTPLASLRANIQVLQDAGRLTDSDRESLRRDVIDELDELTALVADVVELARGSRAEAASDDVRVDEILTEAVERTRRRGDVRVEAEVEPTIVRGEPDRVARAVSNLLENARKWSPPGGLIEVDLKDGVLTVRDHGPGFQPKDLPNVFERFYRADEARKLPGSGLGLAIVRQAAEAHGGYARASNAQGGGALLEVSFGPPVVVAPVTPGLPSAVAPASPARSEDS
jgi:two-component system sensor histidine kinase MprB